MGVLVIGENPRAGMPSCLAKRESVVEDRISGLDSSPPAEAMAFSNVSHHGFDAFVAVDTGRPDTSVAGPFCTSCSNAQQQGTHFSRTRFVFVPVIETTAEIKKKSPRRSGFCEMVPIPLRPSA